MHFTPSRQFISNPKFSHYLNFILQDGSANAGLMNSYAGTYRSDRTLRVGSYAGASVAEAGASWSIFGASASFLKASAHAETGVFNHSVGANATLARAEAHAGPVGLGVGLSLDTGVLTICNVFLWKN
jgi:hypothetical protein